MKKINLPSKEELFDYYIAELHTKEEACSFFKVSSTTFSRWLRLYGIVKTHEQESLTKKLRGDPASAQEKRAATCLRKYGVDAVSKLPETKRKISLTCEKKYGCDCALKSSLVQDKIKSSCIRNYGVDNPFKSPEIQKKARATIKAKYGFASVNQSSIENYDIWSSSERMKQYIMSLGHKPTVRDLMSFFKVSDCSIGNKADEYGLRDMIDFRPSHSKYEAELIDLLKSIGITDIKTGDREILRGQEIDIYIPAHRVGIEFNGDYWHSDVYHNDHNGRSLYHQNKSLLAESRGVFLFHIFEYEWNDPLKRRGIVNRLKAILLKNTAKIGARKCKIVRLSKKQKSEFLRENHIQGNDRSTICYGLMRGDDIVSCMTFVHPKNKKYTWELSRFCNKAGYVVQGGASKLFTEFIGTLSSGDTVASYNDITKTKGDLYKTLGFECVSVNSPNYVWKNFNSGDIRTRYQEQAAGENKRMHDLGYHKICDCGTKTWVYKVK